MSYHYEGGASNLIPNAALEGKMHEFLSELELPVYTEDEMAFAQEIFAMIPEEDKTSASRQSGKTVHDMLSARPLAGFVAPLMDTMRVMPASTDVGDVSWNVPTAQCGTATWAYATPIHAWQTVAQGKSSYAHKGMLLAGKAMACTAIAALIPLSLSRRRQSWLNDWKENRTLPVPG